MHRILLASLVSALFVAAVPAEAGSARLVIAESFPWRTRPPAASAPRPHVHPLHGSGHVHPLHGSGHVHPLQGQGQVPPLRGHDHVRPLPRHHHVIVVPQPVYVVPSRNCLVPGYWTHQWVPQSSTYTVWVPGHWSPEGTWVEGHYEPRTWTSGYWQQLWVPERWTC